MFGCFRIWDSKSNNEFITLFTLVYNREFEFDPKEVETIEYTKIAKVAAELQTDMDKQTNKCFSPDI